MIHCWLICHILSVLDKTFIRITDIKEDNLRIAFFLEFSFFVHYLLEVNEENESKLVLIFSVKTIYIYRGKKSLKIRAKNTNHIIIPQENYTFKPGV